VWATGVPHDVSTGGWKDYKDYNDPDGQTEVVRFKDQGLIHETSTAVNYVSGTWWVATYAAGSRYTGRDRHSRDGIHISTGDSGQ